MRIRTKIFSIVGIMALVTIGVVGVALDTMQRYNTHVDALKDASQRAHNGEALNRYITAVVMDSRGIYAADTTEQAAPFAKGIRQWLDKIDALLTEWRPLVPAETRAAFEAVTNKAATFKTFRTQLATLGETVSTEAADEMGNNETNRANRKALQADVDALVALDLAALDRARAGIDAFYADRVVLFLVLAGAAILVGAGGGAFMGSRAVARPLSEVVATLHTLSSGKLDVALPAVRRNDEIGELWQTVAEFRDALAYAEQARSTQATNEARSQSERRAEMKALADRFESELGEMIRTVASAAESTFTAAKAMADGAERTSRGSMTVASASEQTSANVQAVAASSEELSSSITEIGRQVDGASDLIREAVQQSRLTNDDVRSLAESASKVGAIVTMIQAIAEQTNLLALNATIEAARAGEAGRGFAVVASEVKALASQTARATQDIEVQMGTIQQATERSVAKIADITRRIDNLDHIAGTIAAAATEQNAATDEIARNMQQAAAGASEVAQTIDGVRVTAEDAGRTARSLLDAAEELRDQSAALDGKVASFMSRVRAA